jgi:hypothetical protein
MTRAGDDNEPVSTDCSFTASQPGYSDRSRFVATLLRRSYPPTRAETATGQG